MSSILHASKIEAENSTIEPLRTKSWWIVALGVVYFVTGMIALGSVVTATIVSVAIVGAMMIVAGIAEIINAFQIKSWGKFVLWLLLGALYVVAGLLVFQNPLLSAKLLTLFLGVSLIVSGVTRVVIGFSLRETMSWLAVIVSGVISLLLGLMIVSQWPVASLYVLGLFLGIDLLFAGAGWIAIGLGLSRRPEPQ